jgi:hypothetical protein
MSYLLGVMSDFLWTVISLDLLALPPSARTSGLLKRAFTHLTLGPRCKAAKADRFQIDDKRIRGDSFVF